MAKKKAKPPRLTRHVRMGTTPPRQLGRVSDAEWRLLKAAAAACNKSFARWALEILLPAAERQLKQKGAGNG